jgi:hypothetical protein
VRPDTISSSRTDVDRTLLLGDNRSFGTGCGLGEPPCPAARCADSPPLDWGDSRVSSFPGSGLEHPATVLILGGIEDLYLAEFARHIQFPEWAFFYPGDRDDGRSWDRVLVWNCNVRPVKVLSLVDD